MPITSKENYTNILRGMLHLYESSALLSKQTSS